MRAIEINTMTDNFGHLKLDYPINKKDKKVRVIILVDETTEYNDDENQWLNGISSNPVFDFLNEPSENIYTLKDGETFND
ncbi:MAG: hypothetical protein ACOYMD_10970 [Paludibacter sp.]